MKKIDNIRIGSIEFRMTKSLLDKEYYDIVKWEPNSHYNKEDEYPVIEDDFRKSSEDSNFRIHKDCFKNKEVCYSIASIDVDKEGELKLTSVGTRLWTITKEEWNNLYIILKLITKFYYGTDDNN